MAVSMKRPLLVGGVGLSLGLWLLDSLNHAVSEWGTVVLLGAIALGSGWFWLRRQSGADLELGPVSVTVDRAMAEGAIAEAEAKIQLLAMETSDEQRLTGLRERLAAIATLSQRTTLSIALLGGKNVGKTTLSQRLQAALPEATLRWTDTAALFSQGGSEGDEAVWQAIAAADVALLITAGDLTDMEFQALQRLASLRYPTILVLNKQDQYLPGEQALLEQRLRERMAQVFTEARVAAIAAQPAPLKVRQHHGDGSVTERLEQIAPAIAPLAEQLQPWLAHDRAALRWGTTWRAAIALRQQTQTHLNEVRREKALPLLEQFQWIAAGAAFANPLPALDLLSTAAINGQMVMELGAIYQQRFSLEQAQAVAKEMASLLLKLGLVELSTQGVTAALKSNAATYVAGGVVQGASAAYLTRLAGLSLLAYFEEHGDGAVPSRDRLSELLQAVFQQEQRSAFFQRIAQQSLQRLIPGATPSASSVVASL